MSRPDGSHYRVLGLEAGAGPEEVKAAYRRLALAHHPDRNPGDPGAEARFLVIANAYRVLSDPGHRAEYDAWMRSGTAARPAPARPRGPEPPPPPRKERFPNQFNALLWDLEDLLEANEHPRIRPDWDRLAFQRDLMRALTFWDKWVLGPSGFPDYFMEARKLPPLDPGIYIDTICRETGRLVHFPFTSVSNYFYNIRTRMNRFLDVLDTLDLLAPVPGTEVRLADALIEAQNYAVHLVGHLRKVASGTRTPPAPFVHSRACFLKL